MAQGEGLYPSDVLIERFLASVTASTLAQVFVAPCDMEVFGLLAHLGTAPGAGDGVTVNISNSPTSQIGLVSAYNLWTAANVPTILGTAVTNIGTSTPDTFYGNQNLTVNKPYALNYPLPGPTGTSGYTTAQATSQTTEAPVTSPPVQYVPQLGAFTAPDNTYTDYNGNTASALAVHAGDVLSFVIAAAGVSVSVGAAANLEIVLYAAKR
jgi:hypothetical protein